LSPRRSSVKGVIGSWEFGVVVIIAFLYLAGVYINARLKSLLGGR
jgi:hypothetical protein